MGKFEFIEDNKNNKEDKNKKFLFINEEEIEEDNKVVNELEGVDFSKLEKDDNYIDKKKKYHFKGKKKEVTYLRRVFNTVILLFIFIVLFSVFLYEAFDYNMEHTIKYSEGSKIDYKVYLKDNDFYDKEYLNKNMMYVANLIKNIEIDFNYNFSIDEKSSLDFDYSIVGDLVITDSENENVIGQKSYVLLDKKNASMINEASYSLVESIKIDYDYYNEIANKFKLDYGLDTKSYLKVYLKVHKQNSSSISTYKINDTKESLITIPLSQRAINIKMDSEEISGEAKVKSNSDMTRTNYICIFLSLLFLILILVKFIKLIKLILLLGDFDSKYDRYINKLLNEYDRLIVETTNMPDINQFEVIKISKFTELLDVRDNLKLPIMYYVVAKHHKSYFYIKKDNDIYLLTVKETDF